mmetsp:Transcript_8317/g.34247  ORF Transcript_8317/g.34247 Transcript_8317/m.34247 type:complete len:260 (+) Transcript_8317:371-1150(+)
MGVVSEHGHVSRVLLAVGEDAVDRGAVDLQRGAFEDDGRDGEPAVVGRRDVRVGGVGRDELDAVVRRAEDGGRVADRAVADDHAAHAALEEPRRDRRVERVARVPRVRLERRRRELGLCFVVVLVILTEGLRDDRPLGLAAPARPFGVGIPAVGPAVRHDRAAPERGAVLERHELLAPAGAPVRLGVEGRPRGVVAEARLKQSVEPLDPRIDIQHAVVAIGVDIVEAARRREGRVGRPAEPEGGVEGRHEARRQPVDLR